LTNAVGTLAVTATEFKKFPVTLDSPAVLDVHLIYDNYGTYKTPIVSK
jgi:hypothetical protein